MKTVKYIDVVFGVPDEYNFIAADDNGYVYAYTHRPIRTEDHYSKGHGKVACVGTVAFPLMEIGDD